MAIKFDLSGANGGKSSPVAPSPVSSSGGGNGIKFDLSAANKPKEIPKETPMKFDPLASSVMKPSATPGTGGSTPAVVTEKLPSLSSALSKTLDRTFGVVRAATTLAASPFAMVANEITKKGLGPDYLKEHPEENVSSFDIAKQDFDRAKRLVTGKEEFSKGMEEAAQMYLKERKVGKYGGQPVEVGDIAVLAGIGFANIFGDPLMEFAALKSLGAATKDFATWRQVGQIEKPLAQGTKIVKPTSFELRLNNDLKIKVDPKSDSVVFKGYAKRFGGQGGEVQAAQAQIDAMTSAVTKATGIDARVAVVGDDLVITGLPKNLIPKQAPVSPAVNPIPQVTQVSRIEPNVQPGPVLDVPAVQKSIELAAKPVNETTLAAIESLTPQESAAFGRRIIENMSDNLGLNLSEVQGNQLPDATSFKNIESPDGRPAQINQKGQIEIFVPNLVKDLQTLAKGGQILEHEGPYSQVFKMNPGESMEELSVRYIREVAIHERAHQKTMTLADTRQIQQLRQAVIEAQASKSQEAIIKAKTAQDKFMQELENRANQHVIDNRAQLEKDVFPLTESVKVKQPSAFEKKVLNIQKEERITRGEKSLLKTKIQALSRGSREGYRAGSNEARAIEQSKAKSIIQTTKEQAKRGTELKSLKQRIIDRNRSTVKTEKVKSRYETLIETINNKTLSRAEKRKGLIEYAEAFLPGKLRGKFTRSINGVRNDKDFIKIAERILKESDLNQRKVLVYKIVKEMKGARVKLVNKLPNVKFEKEAQKTLDKISTVINKPYNEARAEMSRIVAEFQEVNPNTILPEELVRELDILKMQGIKDMDAKELRFVLDNIRSIKEQGRTIKEIEHFNKMAERQIRVDKFVDIITGGKPTKSSSTVFPEREVVANRRAQLAKNLKEFFVNRQIGWHEILDILSVKDETSKPGESFISKYGDNLINDGFNNKYKNEFTAIAKVNKLAKESLGLKNDAQLQEVFNEMSKEIDLGEITTTDGRKQNLKMTKLEAVQFYMWFKRERLQATFEQEFGWDRGVKDKIVGLLSEQEKAYGDALLKFYKEHRPSVNEVYSRQFGYDLADEVGYSPAVRDIDKFVPESVLIAKDNIVHASAKGSAIKKATKTTIPLKRISANENLMRYISSMEHYKSFDEALVELKYVFGKREVRQAITDIHGKDFLNLIDNFLDDFARGGVHQEKIVKFIDKLRVRTTRALIGLKPAIAVKQLSGLLNYGIELGEADFAGGVASFWKNPVKKAKFLYDNSPAMQERFGSGFERDIKAALQEGGSNTEISTAGKLSDKAFVFTRAADKFTVMQGEWAAFRAKYRELAGQPFNFESYDKAIVKQAIDYSGRLTNKVQESSRLDTQSALQRGGSYARALTMLAGQPNKYFRILTGLFRNVKAGRISKGTFLRRLLWTWFIVPGAYNLIADVVFGYGEPEERKKKMIAHTLLGPLGTPLVAGNMFMWGIDKIMGENFKYSPTAITAFADDFGRAVDSFNTSKNAAAWTYMIDSVAKFSGIPGTTLITKPIREELKANKKSGGGGGKIIFK